jgi:transcriptional regulator with XRE-family HTH domain
MLAQWIGDLIGRMHLNRVTITQLSEELGVTREYMSMILNGHREPQGIAERANAALDNIISRMNESIR